jgi:hypothetical protein
MSFAEHVDIAVRETSAMLVFDSSIRSLICLTFIYLGVNFLSSKVGSASHLHLPRR